MLSFQSRFNAKFTLDFKIITNLKLVGIFSIEEINYSGLLYCIS